VSETDKIALHPVQHTRLAEEIARRIENLILNRALRLGDALPPERELAARLQVSRNILREAISMLVQKGLLEVRPGSGTYVARPSVNFLRDSLDFFVRFRDSGLYELIEARYALETHIAYLAALQASEEDINHIDECLRELEMTSGDSEGYVEADVCFHSTLAQAAGNEILRLMLDSIRGALRENVRVLLENDPTAVEEAMCFHRCIAEAVREHRPEAARDAMREHLEHVRSGIEELETLDQTERI
jgi:GntR family transcriptional repressor for pyruvate dehydrogenase complex